MSIEQQNQTSASDYMDFSSSLSPTKGETVREMIERLQDDEKIEYYRNWLKKNYAQDSLQDNIHKAKVYSEKAHVPVIVDDIEYSPYAPFHEEVSAYKVIKKSQLFFIAILALVILGLLILDYVIAITLFVTGVTLFYFSSLFLNFALTMKSITSPTDIFIEDEIIDALSEADWPRYTILCPLYKEEESAPQLVRALKEIDYPCDKLQVLVMLEVDDVGTHEVLKQQDIPSFLEIVMLPDGIPRTKPRSCNYGLTKATGDYVVIYDAEDIPDPRQLKKAVLAFSQEGDKLACVQAKLNFYNANQNMLTRWFTIEYATWYEMVMPSLQWANLSIPLGGTSNHFSIKILRELGAWDAFNVTEDCDLGMRLEHHQYYTVVLDSTTYEEANSDLGNWINQRTRWIKGFIITYMVYMRNPLTFLPPSRWAEFFSLQFIIGGRTLIVLFNPILWVLMLIYVLFHPYVQDVYDRMFPTAVFYMGLVSLIFGNLLYIYTHILGAVKIKHFDLVRWAAIMPVYWTLHSIAGYTALYNYIFKPHYWEKTQHGLHQDSENDIPDANQPEDKVPQQKLYDDIVLAKKERYQVVSSPNDDIKSKDGWIKRLFNDPLLLVVGIGTIAIAFASLWFIFSQNLTTSFSEAGINLYIARRIFDSPAPGLGQLSYAQLPLYHLLIAPLTMNDYLFNTGLAGAFVSAISYVFCVAYIYSIVKHITDKRLIALTGTLFFALNPNILFLQALPMGIMLAISTILASIYYLLKWIENDHENSILSLACAVFLATASSYVAWLLFFGILIIIAHLGEKRHYTSIQTQSNLILYSLLGSLGIILWFAWNWIILGNPAIPFDAVFLPSERLILANDALMPAKHNFYISILTLVMGMINLAGPVLLTLTIIGLVYTLISYRHQDILWGILLVAAPVVYVISALVSGQLVIYLPNLVNFDAPTDLLNMDMVALLIIPLSIFGAIGVYACYNQFKSIIRIKPLHIVFVSVILSIVLLQSLFLVSNDKVITLNETQSEFALNDENMLVSYLANNYEDGIVWMSTPDELAYPLATTAGIPYIYLIHEGTPDEWENLSTNITQAEWIIMNQNDELDQIAELLNDSSDFFAAYSLVAEDRNQNALFHRD